MRPAEVKQIAIMAATIKSDPANASEIHTLTQRVTDLTNAVDLWNRWMLWGLLAAAVVAAWIVLTTRLAVNRSKDLSISQGLLDAAKDRQLQADLKDKDTAIGQLRVDLANANADTEKRETELAKEQVRTAEAQTEAAKAQLELRKYVDSVDDRAEPRWKAFFRLNGKAISERLRGNAVSKFEILYPRDNEESYAFAFQLQGTLKEAGWTPTDIRPLTEDDVLKGGSWDKFPLSAPLATRAGVMTPGGIAIISKTSAPFPFVGHEKQSAVAAFMSSFGGISAADPQLPDDLVRIVIGQKQ